MLIRQLSIVKFIKKVLVFLFSTILLLIAVYIVTVELYPSFGGDLTAAQRVEFKQHKNFKNGQFKNRRDVPEKLSFSKFFDLGYKYLTTEVENGEPKHAFKNLTINPKDLVDFNGTRLYWFGHSTFLLQHKGTNILIDPMFGKVPAPLNFLGGKRFLKALPVSPEELPEITYVLFSHDHYDHLDYESVLKLKDKVTWFITPLGLGNHLIRWGIEEHRIIELNWWESKQFEGFEFICTPAQHFSGRKFNNAQQTLWSSWVIQSEAINLYFSGDSGYDTHFKEIGEKYGPFDLSLLECGQYNKLWPDVHMFPQETVKAGIDLKSKKIIPIHWGAFKLALHSWNEPAIEVFNEAKRKNINLQIPKIGEAIKIDSVSRAFDFWWK